MRQEELDEPHGFFAKLAADGGLGVSAVIALVEEQIESAFDGVDSRPDVLRARHLEERARARDDLLSLMEPFFD
jgi:hypothetical protein